MAREENIATLKQFAEAINSGNLTAIRKCVAPNFIDHDPDPDQGEGAEGLIRFFSKHRQAFPDMKVEVDCLVADDNHVSTAYQISGTHQGAFEGIPATHRRFKARGVQIARFENGQIVERWGSSDQLGILNQLGVTLPKAA